MEHAAAGQGLGLPNCDWPLPERDDDGAIHTGSVSVLAPERH
jgi:hypothetical protein